MDKKTIINISALIIVIIGLNIFILSSLWTNTGEILDPLQTSPGSHASTVLNDSYEELRLAWDLNGNVTRYFTNSTHNLLSVPWYNSDSACVMLPEGSGGNLKTGSSCNIGVPVTEDYYCMVTDELSQVGVIDSMGSNETAFDAYYNTIRSINSSYGDIPGWRIFVNETAGRMYSCYTDVNTNCDTASDATARIIISLYNAANNTYFTNTTQKAAYFTHANNLAQDMVQNEYLYSCKTSQLGQGDICWWLAGGSVAKTSGFSATNFAYTGYYPDAIIAMLQACLHTGNTTYCTVAKDTVLNYLQASYPAGTNISTDGFRVPPGLAYRWENTSGIMNAVCTHTCSPVQWDGADAPRAVLLGEVYRKAVDYNLTAHVPLLLDYMGLWNTAHLSTNYTSFVYQYYPNGTAAASAQSGYLAQGFQSQALAYNSSNIAGFNTSLYRALQEYSDTPKTWSWTACAGVYGQAFSMRMLGSSIGRDDITISSTPEPTYTPPSMTSTINSTTNNVLSPLDFYCTASDNEYPIVGYNYTIYKDGILNLSGSYDLIGGLEKTPSTTIDTNPTSTRRIRNTTGYDWQIPGGVNITGIEINFSGSWTFYGGCASFRLSDNMGSSYLSTKTICNGGSGAGASFAFFSGSVGANNDTWNVTWTGLEFDDNNFMLEIDTDAYGITSSDSFSINSFNIEVYYSYKNNSPIRVDSFSNHLKGDEYILSCAASNEFITSNYTNSTMYAVGNAAPNASDALIVDNTTFLTCTYTFTDPDSDAESGSSYAWYKNNNTLNINSVTLANGNYSLTDQLICTVTPSDGTDNGIPINSSLFVVGDEDAPLFGDFIYSTTGTTSDTLSICIVVTDDNPLANNYPRVSWYNPNTELVEGTFSMTLDSNDTYCKSYNFFQTGTYTNITFYARDGSGNENTTIGPNITISSPPTTSPGGGGGGGLPTSPIIEAEYRIDPSNITRRVSVEGFSTLLSRGGEFRIINEGSNRFNVNISIDQQSTTPIARDWLTFDGQNSISNVLVAAGTGLDPNIRFIRYNLNIPTDTPHGNYTIVIQAVSGTQKATHTINIIIGESWWSQSLDLGGFETTNGTTTLIVFGILSGFLIIRTIPKKGKIRRIK